MINLITIGIPIIGITVSSLAYTFGTGFTQQITIKDKYIAQHDGFSRYMIVNNSDNPYRVAKNLWYMKFDNAETWNQLEKNKTYEIKGYGLRVPMLSLYPNIIRIKKVD